MGREGISYNPSSESLRRMFLWIAFHFFPGHCRNKGHKVKFNGVRICVTYVPWGHLCCCELKGRIYGMYSKNVLSLQSLSSMQLEKIPLGFLSFFFFLQGLAAVCYLYFQVYFNKNLESGKHRRHGCSVSLFTRSIPKKGFLTEF